MRLELVSTEPTATERELNKPQPMAGSSPRRSDLLACGLHFILVSREGVYSFLFCTLVRVV